MKDKLTPETAAYIHDDAERLLAQILLRNLSSTYEFFHEQKKIVSPATHRHTVPDITMKPKIPVHLTHLYIEATKTLNLDGKKNQLSIYADHAQQYPTEKGVALTKSFIEEMEYSLAPLLHSICIGALPAKIFQQQVYDFIDEERTIRQEARLNQRQVPNYRYA